MGKREEVNGRDAGEIGSDISGINIVLKRTRAWCSAFKYARTIDTLWLLALNVGTQMKAHELGGNINSLGQC